MMADPRVTKLSRHENLYKMRKNLNEFLIYLNILCHSKLSNVDKVGFALIMNNEVHYIRISKVILLKYYFLYTGPFNA